ncbi:iron chelate uptake ABC transporter family permease subunit, partial [Halorubrum halodurans]
MRVRRRAVAWSSALAAALAVVVVVSAGIGPVRIPPAEVAKIVLNAAVVPAGVEFGTAGVGSLALPGVEFAYRSPFAFPVDDVHRRIVLLVRLPRILLAALVGFSLAAAGTVMQGFFRNPMADPSIIGVSSGAAVGAVAFIVFPTALSTTLTLPLLGAVDVAVSYGTGVSLFAFVGA